MTDQTNDRPPKGAALSDIRAWDRRQAQRRDQKRERIARAHQLRAAGYSLWQIATELGVSKEWLREYAGMGRTGRL